MWCGDLNAEKTKLFLFDWSINSDAINVKMDWSVLEEKSFFLKMLDCLSLLNWIGVLTLSMNLSMIVH